MNLSEFNEKYSSELDDMYSVYCVNESKIYHKVCEVLIYLLDLVESDKDGENKVPLLPEVHIYRYNLPNDYFEFVCKKDSRIFLRAGKKTADIDSVSSFYLLRVCEVVKNYVYKEELNERT